MSADTLGLLVDSAGEIAFALVASLFGLVVGSFANVVIHRLPERGAEADDGPELPLPRAIAAAWRRVSHPRRSHCPRCGAAIRALDNVPVLSFLLLRGRCRSCRAPIAIRYPLVEAANGALWAGLALVHGPSPRTLVLLLLGTSLLVLALIDLELQLLPDAITLPGVLLGLLATLLPGWPLPFWHALLAALAGYAIFAGIALAWQKLRGVDALGQGDWKMAAMLGAFLGWQGLLLTVFLATLTGSLLGGASMLLGKGDMQSKLPLGTFLGLSAIVVLFCGAPLISWYGGLFDV